MLRSVVAFSHVLVNEQRAINWLCSLLQSTTDDLAWWVFRCLYHWTCPLVSSQPAKRAARARTNAHVNARERNLIDARLVCSLIKSYRFWRVPLYGSLPAPSKDAGTVFPWGAVQRYRGIYAVYGWRFRSVDWKLSPVSRPFVSAM